MALKVAIWSWNPTETTNIYEIEYNVIYLSIDYIIFLTFQY